LLWLQTAEHNVLAVAEANVALEVTLNASKPTELICGDVA
jgi:hypothetical protein